MDVAAVVRSNARGYYDRADLMAVAEWKLKGSYWPRHRKTLDRNLDDDIRDITRTALTAPLTIQHRVMGLLYGVAVPVGIPCPFGVHEARKRPETDSLSWANNGAGGGTRTPTLSRAPAPKAGVSANSTTPAACRSYRSVHGPTRRWRASTNSSDPKRERYRQGVSTTHRRRPALIALVIVAACGCLALGWWQWTRFQSVSGTFQNLGYALQWPLFAWFCVYAYRKYVRYEELPPEPRHDSALTEIPAGLLPERPRPMQPPTDDPALAEYNAYLAELAKHDTEKQNRTTA